MFSLSGVLGLFKLIDPKIIVGVLVAIILVWVYFNYNIVSDKTLELEIYQRLQEQKKLDEFIKEIKLAHVIINNLGIDIEKTISQVNACEFEKDILMFECEKEDYNETIVNPDNNYLPF